MAAPEHMGTSGLLRKLSRYPELIIGAQSSLSKLKTGKGTSEELIKEKSRWKLLFFCVKKNM